MNVTWYGHRCVRLEMKDGTVLIDPFDPKDTGLRGPVVKDDLVLLSAYDQPKSVLERIPAESFVVRGPGEYERKGIAVRGLAAFQDSQQGKELGRATIFCIHADDLSVCNLGALGQEVLTDEQIEAIGDPDILIVPVGQGALDAKAAAELATSIEPKIIIPVSADPKLLDKFAAASGLNAERTNVFRMSRKQLPTDRTQLVILEA